MSFTHLEGYKEEIFSYLEEEFCSIKFPRKPAKKKKSKL